MAGTRRYTKKKKKQINIILSGVLAVIFSAYLLMAMSEELNFKYIPTLNQAASAIENWGAPPEENADCKVHFIDVGQGDSILIQSDGSNILIDAGENDQGSVVVDYLKRQGVKKIDLLMMTHPHSDHIGGMDDVIQAFEIGQILMPRLPDSMVPTTRTYTDVLTAIAEKGLKITPAKPGREYTFGKGKITVLGPSAEYEDLNDTSLVCRLDYQEKSFLFTGDMEKTAEADMMRSGKYNLDADVLKVGHHGSHSSTSKDFYKEVTPDYAVISVGDGNSYDHPHKETLKTLRDGGTEIYRTDYQGTIIFSISEGKFGIQTEKESTKQ